MLLWKPCGTMSSHCFGGTCRVLLLLPWRCRQHVPTKIWCADTASLLTAVIASKYMHTGGRCVSLNYIHCVTTDTLAVDVLYVLHWSVLCVFSHDIHPATQTKQNVFSDGFGTEWCTVHPLQKSDASNSQVPNRKWCNRIAVVIIPVIHNLTVFVRLSLSYAFVSLIIHAIFMLTKDARISS